MDTMVGTAGKKNLTVISFNRAQEASPLTLSDLPPLTQMLACDYELEFVRDLQKAYLWMKNDMRRLLIKPDEICSATFRSYYPRPDATMVAFLDPLTVQLYLRTTIHASGRTYYRSVVNSRERLNEDGKYILALLLGGLFTYDAKVAKKWEYILTE